MYGSYFGSCIVSLGSVTKALRVMALCAEHVQWLRDGLDGKSVGAREGKVIRADGNSTRPRAQVQNK